MVTTERVIYQQRCNDPLSLRLATILRDLGQLEQARQLAERALAIAEAAYGPDHPTVATLRANLTLILRNLG